MSDLHEPTMMLLNSAHMIDEAAQFSLDTLQILLHAPNLDHITDEEWKAALKDLVTVIELQKSFGKNAVEHITSIYDLVEKTLEKVQKK